MDWQKMLHGLFTDAQGDHDIIRWGAALGIFAAIGLCVYDELHGTHFPIQDFGIGYCALLAGVGAALKLKKDEAN